MMMDWERDAAELEYRLAKIEHEIIDTKLMLTLAVIFLCCLMVIFSVAR
jgi:hypothetical protein